MSKQVLPTYSIDTLNDKKVAKDLVTDYFAKYLDEHQNLHFPHKHSFYHLVYFSKGSGNQSIDFVNFPVVPGQIYFMIPGQVHGWDFKNSPQGYIVNFSEQYITDLIADPAYVDQFSFFSGTAVEQVITIPKSGRSQIEGLLESIVKEGNSDHAFKDDFVRTALVQLFIIVSRYTTTKNGQHYQKHNFVVLKNFKKLIEKYYKEKKLTKDYAAMLYITPNHLNALSKDVAGRSAGELIRDRILLEAKRLLVNAKLSVNEISTELGFADNSYFTKSFKKYEGVTPDTFRKQIVKN